MFARLWRCQGGIKREPAAPGGPGGAQGVPQGVSGCSFSVSGFSFGVSERSSSCFSDLRTVPSRLQTLLRRCLRPRRRPSAVLSEGFETTSPRFQPMWSLPSVHVCSQLCPWAPMKGPLHIITECPYSMCGGPSMIRTNSSLKSPITGVLRGCGLLSGLRTKIRSKNDV